MSDTNRVQLSMLDEATYGVVASSGDYQIIRITSESLAQTTRSAKSSEIRTDRQIPAIVRTSLNAAGDLGIELSYGAHDDLIRKALCSAGWSSIVNISGNTISASSVDNSFNDSANGFGSLVVGQWIRVSGFANAANNGYFKIVTKAAGKITVSHGTLVTAAASPTISIRMGAQIVNGVAQTSFTVERKYGDLTNKFAVFAGMMVDGFALSASAEAITTGSFTLIGKNQDMVTTAPSAGGYDDAAQNEVMNAIDNIPKIWVNGTSVPGTGISLTLKNNLRARMQINSVGAVSIGMGTCEVSGTFEQFFTDETMIDQYLNWSDSSIAQLHLDAAGNAYIIECPSVKFTDGKNPAGGQNQDVLTPMQWEAKRNASEDVTIRVVRFAAG